MEFLLKFQTGLVGVIGFTGVILTLVVNAYLGRRDRKAKTADATRTLISGLIAELEVIYLALEDAASTLPSGPTEGQYNVPLFSMSKIFEASLDTLGLLTPDVLTKVLDAYLGLDQLKNMVLIHGVKVNDGMSAQFDAKHARRLGRHFKDRAAAVREAIDLLKAAKAQLKN